MLEEASLPEVAENAAEGIFGELWCTSYSYFQLPSSPPWLFQCYWFAFVPYGFNYHTIRHHAHGVYLGMCPLKMATSILMY